MYRYMGPCNEGKLTPFFRYFRERHELLSLWMGDFQFITFRARLTHFAAGRAWLIIPATLFTAF